METELRDFIVEHSSTVKRVYYSLKSKYLDYDDLNELQYHGLWKVWESYDSEKEGSCSLIAYIYHVIRNHALSIIRRKKRVYSRETPILSEDQYSYTSKENPAERYTPGEWKFIEPLYYSSSKCETYEKFSMDSRKYKGLVRPIIERRN